MKRHLHPLNNQNLTIYEAICDEENLYKAHLHAKRGKGWYSEVQEIDKDVTRAIMEIQDMLLRKSYQTSEYTIFIKKDGKKEREIYKLPYFPDRIVHWAILQVIEPILMRQFIKTTYSAIPKRGIHKCMKQVIHDMADKEGTKYCLKLDVRKYYPSINHTILKRKYAELFKDKRLLWLLNEIIDSTDGERGIPIGNYLSQYSGNFYLSDFDHWIKEQKHIKYYYRYMDDIVILHSSKEYLHELHQEIDEYMRNELDLTIKDNWQVFPTRTRGLDFVGYRFFDNYTLLRKSTCKSMKKKMLALRRKEELTFNDYCSIQSYIGWLRHCNSYRLQLKYTVPLLERRNNGNTS